MTTLVMQELQNLSNADLQLLKGKSVAIQIKSGVVKGIIGGFVVDGTSIIGFLVGLDTKVLLSEIEVMNID